MSILKQAESDGTLKKVTEWQYVKLEEVQKKLDSFETEEEQMDYLKYEITCVFYHICNVKGIDIQEVMEEFKKFEHHEMLELYVLYIHGWLIPHITHLRASKKLIQGTKEIMINGKKC